MSAEIGVVGCGTMGIGIVEVAAVRGRRVVGVEPVAAARERAAALLRASLERQAESGRLPEPVEAVLQRVDLTDDLGALGSSDLVIEAVVEREDVKTALFGELSSRVRDDCLLATNTSSLSVTRIAAATRSPERVVGQHFFNPVPRMPLVEVVATPFVEDATLDRADRIVREDLGKETIRTRDRAGFVVNVLLVPYLLSAMRRFDQGLASAVDIDAGMRGGCGMPMGPLELSDLIGLDTLLYVAQSLYDEHLDADFAPPPLLRRLVEAGRLGRKSGHGFHQYA